MHDSSLSHTHTPCLSLHTHTHSVSLSRSRAHTESLSLSQIARQMLLAPTKMHRRIRPRNTEGEGGQVRGRFCKMEEKG
eukprot:c20322_g2_i1 orf=45-281(-)